jgi:hypothetical protein
MEDADQSRRPERLHDSSCHINRDGIRVPRFWHEKPAMWFAQLAGQFALSFTKDETNFKCVISQFDNK